MVGTGPATVGVVGLIGLAGAASLSIGALRSRSSRGRPGPASSARSCATSSTGAGKEVSGISAWGPSRADGADLGIPLDRTGQPWPYHPRRRENALRSGRSALVRTHASWGPPVSTSPRHPVVLFCPSWTGRKNQNTVQAEELASHGFVVVGIDHPYATALTVFPDGRAIAGALGGFLDCSTDESLAASLRVADEQLRLRLADARFVLDELERLDRDDPGGLFTGRLDLGRVGIFGHSFGEPLSRSRRAGPTPGSGPGSTSTDCSSARRPSATSPGRSSSCTTTRRSRPPRRSPAPSARAAGCCRSSTATSDGPAPP